MHVKSIQGEHSAILLTFIKLLFVIKIFILSIFEWTFYTGFTVYEKSPKRINSGNIDCFPKMHEIIVQYSVKYLEEENVTITTVYGIFSAYKD